MFRRRAGRMHVPQFPKEKPPGVASAAWGFTPDSTLGGGDARNVEGIEIQHGSKRRISASGQECGVVEDASVSWNYLSGRYSFDRRQHVRREVADIEHRPEQYGFRQDRLRLRKQVHAAVRQLACYGIARSGRSTSLKCG
jgi:hypothetical protein